MKVSLEPISVVFIALSCLDLVTCKGVGGGGKGRGGKGGGVGKGTAGEGVGGGFGGRGWGGSVGVSNVGSSSGGKGFGRPGLRSRKEMSGGGAAVIVGGGAAAGYVAYKAHQNAKKDREEPDYKSQDATSYYGSISGSEGIRMSAWSLIFVIFTYGNNLVEGGTAEMYS